MSQSTCIEKDCTFAHDGQSFESGGSWVGRSRKTGRLVGLLYAYEKEKKVGDWHGVKKTPACFSREWRSNMGDLRQIVYFRLYNLPCTGVYYKSGSDIVRFQETKA